MQTIQINTDVTYKITDQLEVISSREASFNGIQNAKYIVQIKEGIIEPNTSKWFGFSSSMVYQTTSFFGNLLIAGDWKYQLQTMDIFNFQSSIYQNGKIYLTKQYRNEPPICIAYPFSFESLLSIIKEFNALPITNADLEIQKVLEENRTLKKLINELRKRITGTLKGLK